MKHIIGKITGLLLAVMLCISLLPATNVFATTYSSGSYTISNGWLTGDSVIEEGATLTLSGTEFVIDGCTLTNYGTIYVNNVYITVNRGAFYNYGNIYDLGGRSEGIYDLTLSSITLSNGTLSPSFSPGTREYTVTVDYDVTSIDITPELNTGIGVDSMTVNGVTATNKAATTVSLSLGENTIPIVITGGGVTNTYKLTVTREENADYIISNANFVSAGTLGIPQDMLQWSDVSAPGGYKLEIYTASGTRVYSGTLTNNYTPASEVLTASGTYYFTVYALDGSGNKLSCKISDTFTYTHTHSLTYVEAKDATCTENGNKEYWYCSGCGTYFSDSSGSTETSLSSVTIAATDHSWGPTEYSWGSDWKTCTATHTCQNDNSHVEVANATVTVETTKAATCTESGKTTYKASFNVDWATEQQKAVGISAKGHSLTHVDAKDATCTEDGNTEYWYCSECGKYFSDSSATTEISLNDTVISAKGHSLTHVKTNDATCTEDGNIEYWYCSECGKYFSDSSATMETSLSDTVISATGHTPDEAVKENEVAATCTTDGSYESVVYCIDCGTEISRDTVTVPATGHSWGEWETVESPACEDTGSERRVCSVCGAIETRDVDETGHTWETEYTIDQEPTCTTEGSQSIHCAHCDTVKDSQSIPATGHSYEAAEVVAPTYTEQGYTVYTCTSCGDSYTADYTDILVIDGTDESLSTKTTVEELTGLPDGLTSLYSGVDALVSDLESRVTVSEGYTRENTAVYDVVLQYSTDGGTTWITATVESFPTDGITVTLPYPEGTDASYDFTVVHMFTETSERLGITAGETETPAVTKTDDGLVVTLNGLSPVAIAWKAGAAAATATATPTATATTTPTATAPGTGDSAAPLLWLALLTLCGAGFGLVAGKRKRSK